MQFLAVTFEKEAARSFAFCCSDRQGVPALLDADAKARIEAPRQAGARRGVARFSRIVKARTPATSAVATDADQTKSYFAKAS